MEKQIAKLLLAMNHATDYALGEEMKSAINSRAWAAAIVMALPLFGIDTLIYMFILWSMYVKLSKLAGLKFSFMHVIAGFITNIAIVFVLNMILDVIVVFGWIGMAVVGYLSIRVSAIPYLGTLTAMYGDKVRNVDWQKGYDEGKNFIQNK